MYPLNLYAEQGEQVESDCHMLGPQPGVLCSLFVCKTAKLSTYNSTVTPTIFPDLPRLFYLPALHSQSNLDLSTTVLSTLSYNCVCNLYISIQQEQE